MAVFAALLFCLWAAIARDSSASPSGFLTEEELECFSQEKIYDKGTDKCYKLLTSGPCPRGHWFVLEKPREALRGNSEATIRGVCVREMCRDGEYYWSSTNSCVQAKEKKRLCGDIPGQELLTNVFGEGECACTRNPPRVRHEGDRTKRCHLLYSRGPCPLGQVLGFAGRSEQATCIPDPCYEEALLRKKRGLLPKDALLAPWVDGTCHELGTRGPCPEGLTFKIHPKLKRPNCRSLLNQIFGGINDCDKDVNGDCQKKAAQRKRSTADKFMEELQQVLSKK